MFDGFSLRVIPSIHSALDDKRYFNNGFGITGDAPAGLRAPLRRRDYVEGGSIACLLRPDIALVRSNAQRHKIHDLTARLLRTLDYPAPVLPTHADGCGNPNPPEAIRADQKLFEAEVAAALPGSRFLRTAWFAPIVVPARSADAAGGAAGARQVINPPGIAPLVAAYSVAIRQGDRVFVSGMTGIAPGTQEVVDGGVAAQTEQTLRNIATSRTAAGATLADVDECTVFLVDMADYAAMNGVYQRFFPAAPPARATLAVSALPRPAARVEIKCSAAVS